MRHFLPTTINIDTPPEIWPRKIKQRFMGGRFTHSLFGTPNLFLSLGGEFGKASMGVLQRDFGPNSGGLAWKATIFGPFG